MTVVSDSFDRADDASLGASWTEIVGDWTIASNQAECNDDDGGTLTTYPEPYWRATFPSNSSVQFQRYKNTSSGNFRWQQIVLEYLQLNRLRMLHPPKYELVQASGLLHV